MPLSTRLLVASALFVCVLEPLIHAEDLLSITGHVTNLKQQGVRGLVIHIHRKDGANDFLVKTDKNGDYFYGGLPAGQYSVWVEYRGAMSSSLESIAAPSGRQIVDFKLSTNATSNSSTNASALPDIIAAVAEGIATTSNSKTLSPSRNANPEAPTIDRGSISSAPPPSNSKTMPPSRNANPTEVMRSKVQIIQVNPLPNPMRADQQATLSFSIVDGYRESVIEWNASCDLLDIIQVHAATPKVTRISGSEVVGKNARPGAAVILTLRLKKEQGGTALYGGGAQCYINAKTIDLSHYSTDSVWVPLKVLPQPKN